MNSACNKDLAGLSKKKKDITLWADSKAYEMGKKYFSDLYDKQYKELEPCMTKEQYDERRLVLYVLMKYCESKSMAFSYRYYEDIRSHKTD